MTDSNTTRCSLCETTVDSETCSPVVITKSTSIYCCRRCAIAVAEYEALKKFVRREDRAASKDAA